MNIKLLAITFLSALSQFSSCHKENPDRSYPVEGLWIGTYTYDPETSTNQKPQYFSFVIKPDGGLLVESKDAGVDYFEKGNWTISGNTIHFNYVYTNSTFNNSIISNCKRHIQKIRKA